MCLFGKLPLKLLLGGVLASMAFSNVSFGLASTSCQTPELKITYLCRLLSPDLTVVELGQIAKEIIQRNCEPAGGERDRCVNTSVMHLLRIVVGHPMVTGNILQLSSTHRSQDIREAVGSSEKAYSSTLIALARDPKLTVRNAVARNEATPIVGLNILAQDTDCDVRALVWDNKATHKYRAKLILRDLKQGVCNLEVDIKDEKWALSMKEAQNTETTVSRLAELSVHTDRMIREAVAANVSAQPADLEALATDVDHHVRARVASNPSAPPAVLRILANDINYGVRLYLAANSSAPVDVFPLLAQEGDRVIDLALISNPAIPQSLLSKLAADTGAAIEIREAAEKNLHPAH